MAITVGQLRDFSNKTLFQDIPGLKDENNTTFNYYNMDIQVKKFYTRQNTPTILDEGAYLLAYEENPIVIEINGKDEEGNEKIDYEYHWADVYLLNSSSGSEITVLKSIKDFNTIYIYNEEKKIIAKQGSKILSIPYGYDTILFMYPINYTMSSANPTAPQVNSCNLKKYINIGGNNLPYSDIGVRGTPGAKFFLNNEIFQLGKSGTFELHEDNITITSVGVIDADKITAIDYRTKT